MSDNGLKPCPFCGGEAEIERYGTQRHSCIIMCIDCGLKLESNETFNCGHDWNNRPGLEAQLQKAKAEGIREAVGKVPKWCNTDFDENVCGIQDLFDYADQLEKEECTQES